MSRTRSTVSAPTANQAIGYSISKVRELTGLSDGTLYLDIRKGKLTARKCGTRTIILHSDLMAWLEGLPVKRSPSDLHRARIQQRYASQRESLEAAQV